MKIEHIAVASNSEADSDRFFIELLGLKKTRTFSVSADMAEKFFGVNRDLNVIRYTDDNIDFEVIITEDNSKVKDIFTHPCVLVKNRDNLVENAKVMGFTTLIMPRKDSNSYYLFIKDSFGNLYEVKC